MRLRLNYKCPTTTGRILLHAVIAAMAVVLPCTVSGQKPADDNDTDQYFEMSLDENIASPVIGKKQSQAIVAYQKKRAEVLLSHHQNIETMRNGEVLVATIICDDLFAPNDTLLLPDAEKLLRPYSAFMKTPGMYKVLIVMHSDDTGSEEYTYRLTESRVNAIYNQFEQMGADTSALIPYAMGDTEPLQPNNSRLNRKNNRRLEIYLIPDHRMIEMAKRNALH